MGSWSLKCGPLLPGNFSPPIQFLFIPHSQHFQKLVSSSSEMEGHPAVFRLSESL